jgi:leucyl/phenylalanyl-tRNA--protein transferase
MAQARSPYPPIPWLTTEQGFPPVSKAWPETSPAPGLLAAGDDLSLPTLIKAYSKGIYPWFTEGEPVLWWSPDPRMVLVPNDFRWHRSLAKSLRQLQKLPGFAVRCDTAFRQVMYACAHSPRQGKKVGSWIHPPMVRAYETLAQQGHAHSVEIWIEGQLVAGLYCVSLGRAVFGESMFTTLPNASKIALAALVYFCKTHGVAMIDCQQQTRHLAFMGASPIPRGQFCQQLETAIHLPALPWQMLAEHCSNLTGLTP